MGMMPPPIDPDVLEDHKYFFDWDAFKKKRDEVKTHPKSYWTDEKVQELTRLWNAGLYAIDIANALGGGVTRAAIIGKAHRLDLPHRDSHTDFKPRSVRKAGGQFRKSG